MACPPGRRPRTSTPLPVFAVALVAAAQLFVGGAAAAGPNDWPTHGHDSANTRNQPNEHDISAANAAQLALKWVATTTGDVSGTPAVVDGAVYFGDFGGTVWKLDANTGAVIWSHLVSSYTGIAGDFARIEPFARRATRWSSGRTALPCCSASTRRPARCSGRPR